MLHGMLLDFNVSRETFLECGPTAASEKSYTCVCLIVPGTIKHTHVHDFSLAAVGPHSRNVSRETLKSRSIPCSIYLPQSTPAPHLSSIYSLHYKRNVSAHSAGGISSDAPGKDHVPQQTPTRC